jgi:hypothetical protein
MFVSVLNNMSNSVLMSQAGKTDVFGSPLYISSLSANPMTLQEKVESGGPSAYQQ